MRVKVISNVPVSDEHGLYIGRVLETVEPDKEFADRTLQSEVWVQGDFNEKVKLFGREYEVTDEPESKQQYLVTDPCYVVPNEQWSDYCDATYGGGTKDASDWDIPGVGKIIDVDNTSYGDGEWTVGKNLTIMADAGLVCIVQLKRGYTPTEYQGNAITDSLSTAQDWYEHVRTYEGGEDEEY